MTELVILGPSEVVADRPFTAAEMTNRDRLILHSMLADVRSVVVDVEEGARTLEPYQRLAWKVGGQSRRLLVCDVKRLRGHDGLCVVGFFAERRTDMEIWPLEEANSEIVSEFKNYPGILSYSSMEMQGGHWANLVMHDDPVDTSFWRQSKMHARAVESLSPKHYFNVRIHNGRLTAGLFNRPEIRITKTKYFDYSGLTEWRAERTLVATEPGV